ncbi:hypothetical protein, partial [Agreia sp.]|uniref:hypothetical protein n=1 Tax=Agreia sp. TaxID=1872416 RepID=UPI0035BC64A6
GRSNLDEVVGGVMIAARDTAEERKLPYMGALVANIALLASIDLSTANLVIGMAERLSWPQYVLLSIVSQKDTHPLPGSSLYGGVSGWSAWSPHRSLHELKTEDVGLIHAPMRHGDRGQPIWPTELSASEVTQAGSLLAQMLDLDQIPEVELDATLANFASEVHDPSR